MKEIEFGGKCIDVPEELEELTQEQYLRYLEIVLLYNSGQINFLQARLKLLTLFLRLPVDASMMSQSLWDRLIQHLSLTDPFVERVHDTQRLKTSTGINLLPSWPHRQGPGDMLNSISFGTFIKCSGLMAKIGTTEGDQLVMMKEVAELLYPGEGELPQLLISHACLFFLSVLEIFHTEPLEVDGLMIDFRKIFESKKEKKRSSDGNPVGWTGVAMDIAETGVFGTYQQVLDTPMWDIFVFLYHKQKNHD